MLAQSACRGRMTDMNESDAYHEHEHQERNALERYYHSVYDPNLSEGSLVIALDCLIESLPYDSALSLASFRDGILYPTDYDLEVEPRIAKEKLAILPLAYIGPELERRGASPEVIRQWHMDAVKGVRLVSRDEHTDECHRDSCQEHMMCQKSAICPRRFLERYLTDAVVLADFASLEYMEDRERMYKVAIAKLNVAVEQEIIEVAYAKSIAATFSEEYLEFFHLRASVS